MDLPSAIILHEYPCGKCTSCNEKNYCHTEVCDDYLFFALLGSGNLYLRGYEDEAAEGEKEPLIDEKPFHGKEMLAPLRFRWT